MWPRVWSRRSPGLVPTWPTRVDDPAGGDLQGGLSILGMITCDGSWLLNIGDKFKFLKLPCEADEVYLVAGSRPRTTTSQPLIEGAGGHPVAAWKGEGQR